jgi:hypothetical protein
MVPSPRQIGAAARDAIAAIGRPESLRKRMDAGEAMIQGGKQ